MTSRLTKALPALASCCALCLAHGQGTFRNLDFEQAAVPPTPVNGYGDRVDPALAFPGWTVGATGNTNAYPLYILYNNMTLSAPAIDLIGPEFPNALGLSALQGSYSAMLQYTGYFQIAPFLSQTGLIPADARSISFDATSAPSVALNGIAINLVSVGGGRFAGDVTAFAGTPANLTFTARGFNFFDDIRFSSEPAPEPSAFGLSFLGLLVLGKRRTCHGWCISDHPDSSVFAKVLTTFALRLELSPDALLPGGRRRVRSEIDQKPSNPSS